MILGKKKSNLNTGIFATNEQLESYLNSALRWELADFSTHYKEITNLKQLKEENILLFQHIYNLFHKRKVKLTHRPDSYQYSMLSDKFLVRTGLKIPKKDEKLAKIGYTVRKLVRV